MVHGSTSASLAYLCHAQSVRNFVELLRPVSTEDLLMVTMTARHVHTIHTAIPQFRLCRSENSLLQPQSFHSAFAATSSMETRVMVNSSTLALPVRSLFDRQIARVLRDCVSATVPCAFWDVHRFDAAVLPDEIILHYSAAQVLAATRVSASEKFTTATK